MEQRAGPVIGVVGGSGGVGASTFAAVLARAAADIAEHAVLVDLDVDGGGLDVVLGVEEAPGARWSGLRLAGGELAPEVLVEGLPRWGACAVLAADVAALHPPDVAQVLDTASRSGPVVVDLSRSASPARAVAVASCALVVVLARADVSGLVAAHAVVGSLEARRCGVVVRPGEVSSAEAARLTGAELLGELDRRGRRFDPGRPPRAISRLASGIVTGTSGWTGWSESLERGAEAFGGPSGFGRRAPEFRAAASEFGATAWECGATAPDEAL